MNFGGTETIEPVDKTAAELLIEMARKYPGELVLHTAGPLTNIALAIRLAPDIVDKIKAVYTMGGHIHVNQRFNFWWDAEAAFIFASELLGGQPVTLDFSTWYVGSTLTALAAGIGVILFAFRTALGGRTLLPEHD